MDEKVIAAIAGAIAGLLTGTLSSIVAPWVSWGIEKRKKRLEYRRELIAKWRAMVQNIITQHQEDRRPLIQILQMNTDWYSLKPHLNPAILGLVGVGKMDYHSKYSELAERSLAIQRGEQRNPERTAETQPWSIIILNGLIDEIGQIEKKWGLV